MYSKENFEEIIEKYSDMVYRIALTRTGNKENAEDIFQDVFIKFSEKQPKFANWEHEKAWFIRVTINMCKNLKKSAWNNKVTELDDNLIFESDEEKNVFEEVNKLPENYRTVIYLLYYEGYKVKEISEILKVKEGTIKTWLSRARDILREKLGGGFDEE